MKIVFIGDIHGRDNWKEIVKQEEDSTIFIIIGDYFDSYDTNITGQQEIDNFLEIIEFKKSSQKEVILLIGNHDIHYFPEIGNQGTSRYRRGSKKLIEKVIDENRDHLQMAFSINNILCTHAGVSEEFYEKNCELLNFSSTNTAEGEVKIIAENLNKLYKNDLRAFNFNGIDRYGDDTWQTPIWIRVNSLLQASQRLKELGIIQIFGHTRVVTIPMSVAGYYLIDSLENDEYLIYENHQFFLKKISK